MFTKTAFIYLFKKNSKNSNIVEYYYNVINCFLFKYILKRNAFLS